MSVERPSTVRLLNIWVAIIGIITLYKKYIYKQIMHGCHSSAKSWIPVNVFEFNLLFWKSWKRGANIIFFPQKRPLHNFLSCFLSFEQRSFETLAVASVHPSVHTYVTLFLRNRLSDFFRNFIWSKDSKS